MYPKPQCDGYMIDNVGGLFGSTTRVGISARGNELGRFLSDLFQAEVAIAEQRPGVAGVVRVISPFPNRIREQCPRAWLGRVGKAGDLSGVTRRSGGNYASEHGIGVAVEGERNHFLHVSARRTLPPQSSATRAIVHLARLDRARERFPVRMRNHQHSSRRGILRDDHYRSSVDGELDVVEI